MTNFENSDAENFRLAREVVYNRDEARYGGAQEILLDLIRKGYREPVSVLGLLAVLSGIPSEIEKGLKFLQQGLEANDKASISNLGAIFEEGLSGEVNYEKALSYYSRAAELGSGSAWYNSGMMIYQGKGVERDLIKAEMCFQNAIKLGSQNAKIMLPVIQEELASVQGNTAIICGIEFRIFDDWKDTFSELLPMLVRKIGELNRLDLQQYRYIVEEADRLSSGDAQQQFVLSQCGVMPLEYSGESKKLQEFAGNRPGVDFIEEFCERLASVTTKEFALHVRDQTYLFYFQRNHATIRQTRLKWATHYHNNCVGNAHWSYADKWAEAISAIEVSVPPLSS